jgi:hypothetical protein
MPKEVADRLKKEGVWENGKAAPKGSGKTSAPADARGLAQGEAEGNATAPAAQGVVR